MLQANGYLSAVDPSASRPVGPQNDAPRRAGSVQQATARIMSMADQLEAAFQELQGRLQTVTSPMPPSKNESTAKVSQPCELASHLSDSADRIELVAVAIRLLTDRIEV